MKYLDYILSVCLVSLVLLSLTYAHNSEKLTQLPKECVGGVVVEKANEFAEFLVGKHITISKNDSVISYPVYDIVYQQYNVGDTIR